MKKLIFLSCLFALTLGAYAQKTDAQLKTQVNNEIKLKTYSPARMGAVLDSIIDNKVNNQDAGGGGSVTSVGVSVPSFLSAAGSPVTTAGTIAISLATQSANRVFAGPTSGGAAVPTFRALVPSDLPTVTVGTRNKLLVKYKVSDGDLTASDTSKLNVLSGSGPVVITLDPTGLANGTQYAFFRDQADTAYFDYNGQVVKNAGSAGITLNTFSYVHFNADTFRISTGGGGSGGAGVGDVVGPASATDNLVATFDGTTGKLLKSTSTPNIGTATGSVSGNAGTATALQTARTINGTSFDGTGNITVPAAAGTLTGTTLAANVVSSSLTAVGTIATGVWDATAIGVTKGGTGLTSITQGDLLYGSATNTISKLSAVAVGSYLGSKGTSTAPAYIPLGYVTPQMYGAVVDGSTDDAAAINAALAASDYIYFPPGNYRIASSLSPDTDDHLIGSGNSTIISTTANIPILPTANVSNLIISFITFDGSDTGSTQRGIYANGNVGFTQLSLNNLVYGCTFTDFGGDGIYANFIIGSSTGSNHEGAFTVSNCFFKSNPNNSINFDTRCEYSTVQGSKFEQNNVAIRIAGGNNPIVGNLIVDNTIGISDASGTNDGHSYRNNNTINHNGSNITITSTANGVSYANNTIISGSIVVNGATDVRISDNDIDQAPITFTNVTRGWFRDNYFRQATPVVTIASGSNPLNWGNVFTGTVPAAMTFNTLQGGIQNTQSSPLGPSIETGSWTVDQSGRFIAKVTGTITARSTTSDVTQGLVVDPSYTGGGNNQIFYSLDLNPTGTLATGGFTGTQIGALRVRGRTRFIGLNSSGAIVGNSGWSYENSAGVLALQISDDIVVRGGNAGSPWNWVSTSDGSTQNNNGNGFLMTTGAIGANFTSTSSGAGTANARGLRASVNHTTSSGTTSATALIVERTINQGGGTGDTYGIRGVATETAVGGNNYWIVDPSTNAKSGFGTATPTATLHVVGTTKLEGSLSMPVAGNGVLIKEGTNATMGVATLVGGTVTVNTTKVTANSRIFLTIQGGTLTNVGSTYISARVAGTSFTISSTNILDTADVAWILIEPAP